MKTTKIEWADSTASPWYGCTKVSPGCVNCYAESWSKRAGKNCWGHAHCPKCGEPKKSFWCEECQVEVPPRRLKSKNFERDCRKLNKDAGKQYYNVNDRPPKVFPSLCDWLDPEVPAEWLADMLRVVHECPNLDFLLLTKRPELWMKRMNDAITHATFDVDFVIRWLEFSAGRLNIGTPSNIWVGASCENREQADKRIPELLKIPAKVRFLSLEPLLGPIALSGTRPDRLGAPINFDWLSGIHWVIVGGESGPGARPCDIEWIRDIVRQCKQAGVPVFVKQDCGRIPGQQGRIPDALWARKEIPQ